VAPAEKITLSEMRALRACTHPRSRAGEAMYAHLVFHSVQPSQLATMAAPGLVR
jgi:hypothetical protein